MIENEIVSLHPQEIRLIDKDNQPTADYMLFLAYFIGRNDFKEVRLKQHALHTQRIRQQVARRQGRLS